MDTEDGGTTNVLFQMARVITPLLTFTIIFFAVCCCLGCTLWSIYKKRRARIDAFNEVFTVTVCQPQPKIERLCIICLETMTSGEKVAQCKCTNTFHARCLQRWVDHAHWCPICHRAMADTETGNNSDNILLLFPPVPY